MKKKVIHLIGHLKMGGAEMLITNYATNIDKEKFEFIIITLGGRNNSFNEKKLYDEGIKVIYLGDEIKLLNKNSRINRMINKLNRYKKFIKYIKEIEPDIIHSHLDTNEYIIPLNTKKIKLFHTLHNELNVLFRKDKWRYRLATNYCIKRKNMTLIALHSRMKDEANKMFNTKNCIVINNGIDMRKFRAIKINKYDEKKKLNLKDGSFVIGHVGRFCEQKNHNLLIDIFYSIRQNNKDAHLLLVGTGELENKIKNKVELLGLQNSVTFLGSRSDIPNLMGIMDVFLFPSLYEGFPIVLIEAQSRGIKCVTSDTIPKEVFLTDNIIQVGLDESIEKWCNAIINDNINMEKINRLEDYSIENVVRKLENYYLRNI